MDLEENPVEVEAGMEVVHGYMLSVQVVEVSQVGSLLFQMEGQVGSLLEEVEEELHVLVEEAEIHMVPGVEVQIELEVAAVQVLEMSSWGVPGKMVGL